MTVAYDFETELEGLRLLLETEQTRAVQPYDTGGYPAARSLVIAMEAWASEAYPGLTSQQRHNLRVSVLGAILRRKVGSSNELSTFQASIICNWITDEQRRISPKGKRFLGDLAGRIEVGDLSSPEPSRKKVRKTHRAPRLPNL